MGVKSNSARRPKLDIDADHAPLAHQLAKTCRQDQGSAVRDSGFDNDVRPDIEDRLLIAKDIVRQLDDGNAEPGKRVNILLAPAYLEPEILHDAKAFIGIEIDAFAVDIDDLG